MADDPGSQDEPATQEDPWLAGGSGGGAAEPETQEEEEENDGGGGLYDDDDDENQPGLDAHDEEAIEAAEDYEDYGEEGEEGLDDGAEEEDGASAPPAASHGTSSCAGSSSSSSSSAGAGADAGKGKLKRLPSLNPSGPGPSSKRPQMARRAEVAWSTRLSRTISIDRLPQESKRMSHGAVNLARQPSMEGIERKVIALLLRPATWSPPSDGSFDLSSDEITCLCDRVQDVLVAEPTLLQLSAPVKVFGDIHGQFADLMRLFDQYGSPSREAKGGDISVVDYLFLGDYVDRGKHSLETICLLLALKVHFPSRVFLVRGNHESPEVNARDGFLHECVQRLGGRAEGIAAWRRLNLLFEWLPMGALINGCILGVHGGIGREVQSPRQISEMQRPLRMGGEYAQLLLDLLWSDPTSHDDVMGVHTNVERGSPVVVYGPDRVRSFLEQNGLQLIVRAHECVMDGFQRFAGGRLITVFSATNYCNRWANAGAILLIGKDLEITPKMIYPLDDLEDAWIDAPAEKADGSSSPPDEDLKDMRPPTPPRDCPSGDGDESPRRRAGLQSSVGSMGPPPPRRLGSLQQAMDQARDAGAGSSNSGGEQSAE
jgi:protein phosphatase